MMYGSVIRIESLPIRLKNALETLSKDGAYGIEMNETETIPMGVFEADTGKEEIFENREIARLNNAYFSATVDFSLHSFFGNGEAQISLNRGDAAEFYSFVKNLKKVIQK